MYDRAYKDSVRCNVQHRIVHGKVATPSLSDGKRLSFTALLRNIFILCPSYITHLVQIVLCVA